jgi:TRAP transporter TAXI family solute receptor
MFRQYWERGIESRFWQLIGRGGPHKMTKRDFMGYLALLLAIVATILVYWYLSFVPYSLKIGVAPQESEPAEFLHAFATALRRDQANVRLVVSTYDDPRQVETALSDRAIDLAVVRTDRNLPTSMLGVATLHTFAITLFARPGASIERFADLEGKNVAILGRSEGNAALFEFVARLHGLDVDRIRIVNIPSSAALVEAKNEKLDAVFLVSPRGGRGSNRVFKHLETLFGAPPNLVPISATAPLRNRNPVFAEEKFAEGEFAISPMIPPKPVVTAAFPALIVAHSRVEPAAVQEFTRQLFRMRQALAAEFPAGGRIAALSTKRDAPFQVHPGAATYYDANEMSFLEKYSDITWLLLFGFSSILSLLAWIIRLALPKQRQTVDAERRELIQLIEEARSAGSYSDLDKIQSRADNLIIAISDQIYRGQMDAEKEQRSFDLLLARLETIIAERRSFLPKRQN